MGTGYPPRPANGGTPSPTVQPGEWFGVEVYKETWQAPSYTVQPSAVEYQLPLVSAGACENHIGGTGWEPGSAPRPAIGSIPSLDLNTAAGLSKYVAELQGRKVVEAAERARRRARFALA